MCSIYLNLTRVSDLSKSMAQYLAEYLVKAIEREAKRDGDIEWSQTENGKLLKMTRINIKKDNVGWWNFTKQTLNELRP